MPPTVNQLVKKGRDKKKKRSKSPALEGHPQLSGVVLSVGVVKPKKPNSGHRHRARVQLSNGKKVNAFIPGEGHSIMEHTEVLVRGGRRPDLPGVKYTIIRGAAGDPGEKPGRRKSRSKYGVKKPR